MIRSLLAAFSFLTVLPGRAGKFSEADLAGSPAWFPLVGYFIGFICLGLAQFLIGRIPLPMISFLTLLFLVLITGGLHLDGLADWADSLAGDNPEQRLKIMKDTHHGSFGIIALAMVLLGKYLAINLLLQQQNLILLALAPGLSRMGLTLIMSTTAYARPEGGLGTIFERGKKKRHLAAAGIIALLPLIILRSLPGLICLGVILILSLLFRRDGKRRLGGFTGDLLGASAEVCELATLFGGVLLAGLL